MNVYDLISSMGQFTGSDEDEVCICGHRESSHRVFLGCRGRRCACNHFLNATFVTFLRATAAAELVQAEAMARELADYLDLCRLEGPATARQKIFLKAR